MSKTVEMKSPEDHVVGVLEQLGFYKSFTDTAYHPNGEIKSQLDKWSPRSANNPLMVAVDHGAKKVAILMAYQQQSSVLSAPSSFLYKNPEIFYSKLEEDLDAYTQSLQQVQAAQSKR